MKDARAGLRSLKHVANRVVHRLVGRTLSPQPAKRLPGGEPRPRPLLFVAGCPRSGTSWIAEVFAHHPQVLIGRESHLFERVYKPIRGNSASGSELRRQLLEDFDRRRDENPVIGVHRYVERPVFAEILERCVPKIGASAEARQRAAEQSVRWVLEAFRTFNRNERGDACRSSCLLVEKTPLHILYGEQILEAFPNARLLHVVRDGRDVCVSLQIRSAAADWPFQRRQDQIRLWQQCVRAGLRLAEDPRFRHRIGILRYEDMKRTPVTEVERIYRLAGLPCDRELAQRVAARTDFSRNKRVGNGQHKRQGAVGDWKKHFTPVEIAQFRHLAGSEFTACGYRFEDSLPEIRKAA